MKLILAIINNDDSAVAANALTAGGFSVTKLSTTGGFLQVGYDARPFQREIDQQVVSAAQNRHIGQDGCIIICDAQGLIVSDRDGHEGESIGL